MPIISTAQVPEDSRWELTYYQEEDEYALEIISGGIAIVRVGQCSAQNIEALADLLAAGLWDRAVGRRTITVAYPSSVNGHPGTI